MISRNVRLDGQHTGMGLHSNSRHGVECGQTTPLFSMGLNKILSRTVLHVSQATQPLPSRGEINVAAQPGLSLEESGMAA